jgi:hypothetical protein
MKAVLLAEKNANSSPLLLKNKKKSPESISSKKGIR